MRTVTLITTGGTIEKTYDEATGSLANRRSVVDRMLRRLRLPDVRINPVSLMQKDSLELTETDRARIADMIQAVGGLKAAPGETTGIIILHGTDTLAETGEFLTTEIRDPRVPIILTGAMRPFEMVRSDALQNLTEAIFATGVLEPGVWCIAHGRALRFPGVTKDRQAGTFIKQSDG
ncbi:MAG: asparaginase domain-containing protein [Planctomycetota bacterium]